MTDTGSPGPAIPSPEEFLPALREALLARGTNGAWLLGRIDEALSGRAVGGLITTAYDSLRTHLDVLEDYLCVLPESLARANLVLTALNENSPVEVTVLPTDTTDTVDIRDGYGIHDLYERSGIDTDWSFNRSVISEMRALYGLK
jgi:hypothetical protein